jgi:hypothetical protein
MSEYHAVLIFYASAIGLCVACIATGLVLMYFDATRFARARARSDRRRMKARARRLRAFRVES